MPTHDPTGDPIDKPPPAKVSIAEIRKALCLGPDECRYDHEHVTGNEVDDREIRTIDPKEHL